jgi:hypothetical protein
MTMASVMNDGNYSLAQFQNTLGGPIDRIDVFRASQPAGKYGVTAAGTRVAALCGIDHLAPHSNKVFRNLYSRGQAATEPGKAVLPALLEGRYGYELPGLPLGSWEDRIRDVDVKSPSYGRILRIVAERLGRRTYRLTYEIRGKGLPPKERRLIASPLTRPVASIAPTLPDLGAPLEELPPIDADLPGNPLSFEITPNATRRDVDGLFEAFTGTAQGREGITRGADFGRWRRNWYLYESFGDLHMKSSHPGTNLVGNAKTLPLLTETLVTRAYR